jgi:hypothetical protein
MQKLLRMKKSGIVLSILFMLFVIAGCEKDDPTVSQELLEETTFAENVFAQLSSDVDDAVPFEGVSSGRKGFLGFGCGFNDCMTRTVETPENEDYPKIITIEYAGECSSSFKDVTKSGKIIITLTGHPSEVGSQRIVTFVDFMVNGNAITGTKTITFKGAGQYTSTLKDGNIITKDGDVIIRESSKTKTLVEGGDTEDRSDDVYNVTGEITGVIIDEESGVEISYTKLIDENNPLRISRDCFWITKGIVTTTIGGAVTTVDFGDGTCDDLATRIDADGEEIFTMEMRIKKMWRHNLKK